MQLTGENNVIDLSGSLGGSMGLKHNNFKKQLLETASI